MEYAIKRMHDGILYRAMDTWCAMAQQARGARALANRVLRRMKYGAVWTAWNSWKDWQRNAALANMQADLEEVMRLLEQERQARLHDAQLSEEQRRVAEAEHQARMDELLAQMDELRHAMRGSVFQRAMMRIKMLPLARALGLWQEVAAELKEQRRMLRRGCMRLLQRSMAMALTGWRGWLWDVRAMKARMATVAKRLQNSKFGACFNSWIFAVRDAKERKEAAARIMRRMLHAKVFASWSCWREVFKFSELWQLRAKYENEKKCRKLDLELCALEMAELVRQNQLEAARAEFNAKQDREAMEKLLAETEAAAEAARRDIATALQRERRYLQQMQEEKDKEISRLEKQLAIFCPPYESKLVNP